MSVGEEVERIGGAGILIGWLFVCLLSAVSWVCGCRRRRGLWKVRGLRGALERGHDGGGRGESGNWLC